MNESKDMIRTAFNTAMVKGPICGEPMRGIEFDIMDGQFHADNVHRGAPQVLPMARRAMQASIMKCEPRLMEPIYLCEIECTEEVASKIYGIVSQRRGVVIDETTDYKSRTTTYKVYLPVIESIGFDNFLKSETGGQAFPQCTPSHWEIIQSNPLDPDSRAGQMARDIRKRKGLSDTIFDASHYEDRL